MRHKDSFGLYSPWSGFQRRPRHLHTTLPHLLGTPAVPVCVCAGGGGVEGGGSEHIQPIAMGIPTIEFRSIFPARFTIYQQVLISVFNKVLQGAPTRSVTSSFFTTKSRMMSLCFVSNTAGCSLAICASDTRLLCRWGWLQSRWVVRIWRCFSSQKWLKISVGRHRINKGLRKVPVPGEGHNIIVIINFVLNRTEPPLSTCMCHAMLSVYLDFCLLDKAHSPTVLQPFLRYSANLQVYQYIKTHKLT